VFEYSCLFTARRKVLLSTTALVAGLSLLGNMSFALAGDEEINGTPATPSFTAGAGGDGTVNAGDRIVNLAPGGDAATLSVNNSLTIDSILADRNTQLYLYDHSFGGFQDTLTVTNDLSFSAGTFTVSGGSEDEDTVHTKEVRLTVKGNVTSTTGTGVAGANDLVFHPTAGAGDTTVLVEGSTTIDGEVILRAGDDRGDLDITLGDGNDDSFSALGLTVRGGDRISSTPGRVTAVINGDGAGNGSAITITGNVLVQAGTNSGSAFTRATINDDMTVTGDVTVQGGGGGGANGDLVMNGDLTANSLSLNQGTAGGGRGYLYARGDLTLGSAIQMSDATSTSLSSRLYLQGTGNQNINVAIETLGNERGELRVDNDTNTATINGSVGSVTGNMLYFVQVGQSTSGNLVVEGDLAARDIEVNGSSTGAAILDVNGNIKVGSQGLSLDTSSFSSGDDAIVQVEGNITSSDPAAILSMDSGSSSKSRLVLDGSGGLQTVDVMIEGNNKGEILVKNGTEALFTRSIGANSSNRIALFTIESGASVTLEDDFDIRQSSNSNDAVLADGELTLSSNGADALTFAIDSGRLAVNNTLKIEGAEDVELDLRGGANINGNVSTTLSGGKNLAFTNGGTVNFGASSPAVMTFGNTVTSAYNSTFIKGDTTFRIRKSADFSPNNTDTPVWDMGSGNFTIDPGATLNIEIDPDGQDFSNGTQITVVTTTGLITNNGTIALQDNPTLTLTDATVDETKDITVRVGFAGGGADIDGAEGDAEEALGAVMAIPNLAATDTDLSNAVAALGVAETQKAGEQLAGDPTSGGAVNTAVTTTGTVSLNFVEERLAVERFRDGARRQGSGVAYRELTDSDVAFAGDAGSDSSVASALAQLQVAGVSFNRTSSTGAGVWFRPYVSYADQNDRDGTAGYTSLSVGGVAGYDNMVTDKIRAGVAAGYVNSSVDGEDSGSTESDVSTYLLGAYADYSFENGAYLDAMALFGKNFVDSERIINFGGLDRTAKGDYTSEQYTLRFGGGVPFSLAGNHVITPTANLQYTYITGASFTETGAGGANRRVSLANSSILDLTVGGTWSTSFTAGNGYVVTPEARADISYDLIGDRSESTVAFIGGGAGFAAEGADPSRLSGRLGFGLSTQKPGDPWIFSVDYDADIKSRFLGHTIKAEIRYEF